MRFVNFRSMRFRLTVWYALILSAALCIFSGLIWVFLDQRLTDDIRAGLNEAANRFEPFVKEEAEDPSTDLDVEIQDFCQGLPSTTYLKLTPAHGAPLVFSESGVDPRGHYEIVTRSITLRDIPYSLEIGASRAAMHRTLELLQTLLFGLVPVVILASCIGGALLSRRALRPVDEITSAARAIGIENLASRLPLPGTDDELERLTETWNATLQRLDSAVTALSRFAGDASHELRTPVAVIRTTAELALRRERDPDAYRQALRDIAAVSERMTKLVEDLLFLARRDTKGTGLLMEGLDLRDVVDETARELSGLAETRGIDIRVTGHADEAIVAGNPAALRRLFLALLDNALKYSAPGSEVLVSVLNRDGAFIVRVEDHGVGISAADLPHIFQRFYRADKSRTDGGHGLGLSLALSIAEAHDAAIDVKSVPGRGSTFEVSFTPRYTMSPVAAS